jgi:hypothetical protein
VHRPRDAHIAAIWDAVAAHRVAVQDDAGGGARAARTGRFDF